MNVRLTLRIKIKGRGEWEFHLVLNI